MAAIPQCLLQFGEAATSPDIRIAGVSSLVRFHKLEKLGFDLRVLLLYPLAPRVAKANTTYGRRFHFPKKLFAAMRYGLRTETSNFGQPLLATVLQAQRQQARHLSSYLLVAFCENASQHRLPARIVQPRRTGRIEGNLKLAPGNIHA